VIKIGASVVTLDFNPPFAGTSMTARVRIEDVSSSLPLKR
jgi:FKBP-type peptidyl-prolyl cis-trans isomerase 2